MKKLQKMPSQKARQYEQTSRIVHQNASANKKHNYYSSGWTHISEILQPRIEQIIKMWTSK